MIVGEKKHSLRKGLIITDFEIPHNQKNFFLPKSWSIIDLTPITDAYTF